MGYLIVICYFLFITFPSVAFGDNWEVCTLEGVLSLAQVTALEIQPPFELLQNVLIFILSIVEFLSSFVLFSPFLDYPLYQAVEANAALVAALDIYADAASRDEQYSFISCRMKIVPEPSAAAGAAADYSTDRRVEVFILNQSLLDWFTELFAIKIFCARSH